MLFDIMSNFWGAVQFEGFGFAKHKRCSISLRRVQDEVTVDFHAFVCCYLTLIDFLVFVKMIIDVLSYVNGIGLQIALRRNTKSYTVINKKWHIS